MNSTRIQSLVKALIIVLTAMLILFISSAVYVNDTQTTLSQVGSSGAEVRAIQEKLKERGLFNVGVTGYYGEQTRAAVLRFQKQQGIKQTGVAGPATLKALGISIGSIPSATQANTGQVAVGAVVLNRIKHPSFPDTLSGVIYQNGAFTAIVDGQFNEPITDSAYKAAKDALNGWDPTGGCIYYYNPSKTSNAYMHSKPTVMVIGSHRFCK